jgi:hypothetical protein
MSNLALYEDIRRVPEDAKKPITAGRLKGMTDINPMWRIKVLTERFGICGIGWYYECTKQWIEDVGDERVACVNINLYVKVDGEWSKPIFGTGGSKLSTMERGGLYVSDECFKMATTDAISVACKNLGMGADVYWSGDRTKYSSNTKEQNEEEQFDKNCADIGNMKIAPIKVNIIKNKCVEYGITEKTVLAKYNLKALEDMTESQFSDAVLTFERTKKQ